MIIDGFIIDEYRGFEVRTTRNRLIRKYQKYKYAKEFMQKHPGTVLVYYGTKIEKGDKNNAEH